MKRPAPHEPVALSVEEVRAIQSIWEGKADPHQQRLALEAILGPLCETDAIGFHMGADGDRLTSFAAGKRYVGNSIRRIITTPLTALARQSTAIKG
jgi:hypothetical protein